jgi:hypothetical protein
MGLSTRSRKYMRMARHRSDPLTKPRPFYPAIGDQKCSLERLLKGPNTPTVATN